MLFLALLLTEEDDDGDEDEDAGNDSYSGELSEARHVITVPDFAPAVTQQLRQVSAFLMCGQHWT